METVNLIDTIHFDFLMVFKYSDNNLADSSKLSDKIDDVSINKRYIYIVDKFYKNFYKEVL